MSANSRSLKMPDFYHALWFQVKQKTEFFSLIWVAVFNTHFPALIVFKAVYAVLWMIICFPPCNLFPHRRKLSLHGKCSDALHSLILPGQTLEVRRRPLSRIAPIYSVFHFELPRRHLLLVNCYFTRQISARMLPWTQQSWLIQVSDPPLSICPILHFLPYLIFIPHTSFNR